jgi:hypothetical protein
MNYEAASAALLKGYPVRRTSWHDRTQLLTRRMLPEIIRGQFKADAALVIRTHWGYHPFFPHSIDVRATDWSAVPLE